MISGVDLKIGCAILAGGKSSRMGQDKALLEYKGQSFIDILCKELDFFEEKYIARGSNPKCLESSWKNIDDVYEERGPIGGMHAVLSVCDSDAMFFTTCDMPLLQRNLVEHICGLLDAKTEAVIAVSEDGRKNPLCGIYRKSVADVLTQQIQAGENRIMAVLDKLQVVYVPVDKETSQQLQNINTQDEYCILKKLKI